MAPMTLREVLSESALSTVSSPTLTNPDMVLPADFRVATPDSPERMGSPPSPSYLRQNAPTPARKKEKRGLMSRKMLLLRSRTGSSTNTLPPQSPIPRSVASPSSFNSDYNSAYGSSPILMDVGNLAPERLEEPRLSLSRSSFNSEDMAGVPSFLAKYELPDGPTTDDEMFDSDSATPQKYGYSVSIEGGLDAHRRQQEEDELNSAILSRRAEHILANAKKRLNLMEGNLRGARDLVAPLTAANLKRATSLGSAHHTGSPARPRYPIDLRDTPVSQPPSRHLQGQASSPTIGREYYSHSRGMSDIELPERPYSALSGDKIVTRNGRIPIRTSERSWTPSLRNSKSHDSLGSNGMYPNGRASPLHPKSSPDGNLGVLIEDEILQKPVSVRSTSQEEARRNHGLGIERPSSHAEDLREQMTSLKGKISNLKERAREDSMRRQSMQTLRTASPFNNAVASPPEFFYTQAQSYGSPVLDTNAGVGHVSDEVSPATSSVRRAWEAVGPPTGSVNAFAQRVSGQTSPVVSPLERDAYLEESVAPQSQSVHKRTPSGRVIIQSSYNRYSHHQERDSQDLPLPSENLGFAQASPGAQIVDSYLRSGQYSPPSSEARELGDAEDDISVYEDAEVELPPVVAHEDRDDAFDYKNFFLSSALGSYSQGRRSSDSSTSSMTSIATARGPTFTQNENESENNADDADDEFNPNSGIYPPPTPQTPERLKEIERHIQQNSHQRSLSTESISTVATFATANEGEDEDETTGQLDSRLQNLSWPMPPSQPSTTRGSGGGNGSGGSRPSTAIKRPLERERQARPQDESFDRTDSGVGLSSSSSHHHHHHHHQTPTDRVFNKPNALPLKNGLISPPTSPSTAFMHDPTTLVVNALINPEGRQLGLKEKAVLFGVVESLRGVVGRLQWERVDEGVDAGQGTEDQGEQVVMLRRRLEQARRVLEGAFE
ncbi:hypothetical protein LTR62_000475 [Meristemomyces frigidus]|uniref:Uncharacterized protein n=1 Tax=Meristemomyces frigidus TaxID=1508187 RepID=A0AAN7TMR0_9PEZI|nr:hypothetical protein LTR62_000475 [Meristemomyces frigidus]